MKQTSFRKNTKASKSPQIPGTHTSLHNGQLLISTGVPSFDAVIGGGIPVGCVLLIEEDQCNQYANVLMKYFLAEGIVSGQSLYLAATDDNAILNQLPQPIIDEPINPGESPGDDLKIAWRYEKNPQVKSSMDTSMKFGHYYDNSKTMDIEIIKKAEIKSLNVLKSIEANDISYKVLTKNIIDYINQNNKDINTAVKSKLPLQILRISINSAGSPLWQRSSKNENRSAEDLKQFLLSLRIVMRKSLAVCCVTIPATELYSEADKEAFRHLSDIAIQLESFRAGTPNALYKDYHGMFHIKKLPVLNSILPFMPDSLDLGFKMRRKKFSIEKLHLPPDIGESASRGDVENDSANMGCGGGTKLKTELDF